MNALRTLIVLAWPLSLLVCSASEPEKHPMKTPPTEPAATVVKTDVEWKQQLTPEQYRILRHAATEPPHGKVYEEFKKQGQGTYHCAGCGALLFSSDHKFDSRCGWPSFYDPAKAQNVKLSQDYSTGMLRTEVTCAVCGGHLGHRFDGEGFHTPTDQRYCINGGALKFVPAQKP
ncbi:MAG: peptide-methionine (R)-S-oxide reductase MsrB [Verrucomicrobia bacterium]|nr:MAG: peptide-methionine (R)-S-oxide reductase MsrB [Verrucomicrobiota bacterium]